MSFIQISERFQIIFWYCNKLNILKRDILKQLEIIIFKYLLVLDCESA